MIPPMCLLEGGINLGIPLYIASGEPDGARRKTAQSHLSFESHRLYMGAPRSGDTAAQPGRLDPSRSGVRGRSIRLVSHFFNANHLFNTLALPTRPSRSPTRWKPGMVEMA